MQPKSLLWVMALFLGIILAACGTIVRPQWAATSEGYEAIVTEHDGAAGAAVTMAEAAERPTASTAEGVAFSGDPSNGEALYNTMRNGAELACVQCHLIRSEEELIGPSAASITANAQSADDAIAYLYEALTEHHTLSGRSHTPYAEMYNEEELYDIIAYLLSLDE